jgi:uncharacterized protein
LEFEWDSAKARANLAKHGVAFEAVFAFEWDSYLRSVDNRMDYGEERIQALGKIKGRVHVLVYAMNNNNIRVISLRKANIREVRIYDRHLQNRTPSGFR